MNENIGPELDKMIDLLKDIKKLMVLNLYKRDDVNSDEIAEALDLKASTVRGMFSKRKGK